MSAEFFGRRQNFIDFQMGIKRTPQEEALNQFGHWVYDVMNDEVVSNNGSPFKKLPSIDIFPGGQRFGFLFIGSNVEHGINAVLVNDGSSLRVDADAKIYREYLDEEYVAFAIQEEIGTLPITSSIPRYDFREMIARAYQTTSQWTEDELKRHHEETGIEPI